MSQTKAEEAKTTRYYHLLLGSSGLCFIGRHDLKLREISCDCGEKKKISEEMKDVTGKKKVRDMKDTLYEAEAGQIQESHISIQHGIWHYVPGFVQTSMLHESRVIPAKIPCCTWHVISKKNVKECKNSMLHNSLWLKSAEIPKIKKCLGKTFYIDDQGRVYNKDDLNCPALIGHLTDISLMDSLGTLILDSYQVEVLSSNPTKRHECIFCEKVFQSPSALKTHKNSHTREKRRSK
ncbi:16356_t:CDS:2 [Acaulospora morrowiae]|uniref:16356_t:CDS:1 n=1 Tax=Acaulospora morrowiae TaxID=94023 RepID=A0A9N9G0J1_9GLOM|nr:16356_t:CDS:2 [Acaulospora morrowiae]